MRNAIRMKRIHLLMIFFVLNIHRAASTSCGDGGDGSVPGCCYDQGGVCTTGCDVGYGLLNNKTKCGKCKDPKCAECNGDISTCNKYQQKRDPNCNDQDEITGKCYDCADGYGFPADGTACVKCQIPNCSYCKTIKTCSSCAQGYGLVKGTCEKCSAKLNGCYNCDGNTSKCPKGKCSTSANDKDGNYRFSSPKNGVCTTCPVGVYSCFDDGFKCQSGYTSAGANTCIKSTTVDFSGDGASATTVNGTNETTSASPAVSTMASTLVMCIIAALVPLFFH